MVRLLLGPTDPIIEEIRRAARKYPGGRTRIVVAWAKEEGAYWLLDALGGLITNVQIIVGLNERATTVEALLRLLPHVSSLTAFFKHPRQTFHPKLYWFDDGREPSQITTLIVGSSNLTRGGLLTNFEASLVVEVERDPVTESERLLLSSVATAWTELANAPYAFRVTDVDVVRQLYEAGYLVVERTLRRRQRQTSRAEAPLRDLPTAPPPRTPAALPDRITIPFPLRPDDAEEEAPPETRDPARMPPLPDRFFVRTLTPNDVEKLHGRTPGTFEPDLGETARDQFSAFWGWPNRYRQVTRRLPRREWSTQARLISSLTPVAGVPVDVTLWYRAPRPGHPAEHRLRLGPIGRIRSVVPATFDTASLLVIERAPEGVGYQFVLRLITAADTGYSDFCTYLVERRPQHQFGYGP